MTTFSFIAE